MLAQAVARLAGIDAQGIPGGREGKAACPRAHIQNDHAAKVNQLIQPFAVPIGNVVDLFHRFRPGIDNKSLVITQKVGFSLTGCPVIQVMRHQRQRRVHIGGALRRLIAAEIHHMGITPQRPANQGLIGRVILFVRLPA